MSDLFTVQSGSLPPNARVMGFTAREALSSLFELSIYVAVDGGAGQDVELEDAVGSRLTLTCREPGSLAELTGVGEPFVFSGVVSAMELVSELDGRSVFAATVVPQLWSLQYSVHSRVFTQKTVPEILEAILQENGIDAYELRLSGSYAVEAHVSQYKESDFAFLSRWMEREGIYYFFEHSDGVDKLILADEKQAHSPLRSAPVRFHPASQDELAQEAFHQLGLKRNVLPAMVTLNDYDYAKPALGVSGRALVSQSGLAQLVMHSDRFFAPDDGSRLANLRAEALLATETQVTARGTARKLRSGYTFEVYDHPRAELSAAFLAVSLKHVGRQLHGASELDALISDKSPEVYRVEVQAIPAATQFRAARSTPWPQVPGYENGVVDGSGTSNYAQIDDAGRYSIKLKYDEGTAAGGQSSTWVRMAQPHGGQVEGFHFPLRKGTEVLVQFLDGDPDRPLIAAVLPTAATPSPVTSGNNTKNVLQTGGSTRVEIEDAAGGQYMHTTTPVQNTSLWMGTDATSKDGHNVELTTGGSGASSFGTYLHEFVGARKTEHVVGDHTRNFDANYMSTVASDVQQTYSQNQTTSVLMNVLRTVVGTVGDTVEQAVTKSFASSWDLHVVADVTEDLLANSVLKVKGNQDVTIDGKADRKVEGTLTETVNGLSKHVANADYSLEVKTKAGMHATADFKIRGDTKAQLSSPDTTINGDTSVNVHGGSKVDIISQSVSVIGSSSINLNGGPIEILGGTISIVGANIKMESAGTLDSKADGPRLGIAGGAVTILGGPLIDAKAGLITLAIVGPPSTGLGADVDAMVAMSPTLMANIQALLADGWTIQYGPAGQGSYCDKNKKIIVIDSNEKGNPTAVTQTLAHESGHALYEQDPYVPPDGLTRQQYIDQNVNRNLKDEAEATLTNATIRSEINNAGGPDIGIAGQQGAQYQAIADKYPNPADRDLARQEIANVFGAGEVPSVPKPDGTMYGSYNDYYGQAYADFWDANVGGGP